MKEVVLLRRVDPVVVITLVLVVLVKEAIETALNMIMTMVEIIVMKATTCKYFCMLSNRYIANLSSRVTEEDLRKEFENIGPIKSINIPLDNEGHNR